VSTAPCGTRGNEKNGATTEEEKEGGEREGKKGLFLGPGGGMRTVQENISLTWTSRGKVVETAGLAGEKDPGREQGRWCL